MFREVIEIAKELESGVGSVTSLRNAFTDPMVRSRDRLKELCETILFTSPIDFGRKAEDFLWKRCYHDLTQFYKLNKMVSQLNCPIHIQCLTDLSLPENVFVRDISTSSAFDHRIRSLLQFAIRIGKTLWDKPSETDAIHKWRTSLG